MDGVVIGVSVITAGTVVIVAVEVFVGAGNISVMAGNGTSVLVSVMEGVESGIDESAGVGLDIA